MISQRKRLGDLLLSLRLVTQEQLQEALTTQKSTAENLGKILIDMGVLTEDHMLNALASQAGVAPWRLDLQPPEGNAVLLVPVAVCKEHQIVPIRIMGDLLVLGMRDPQDMDAVDLVRNLTNLRLQPVMVDSNQLYTVLEWIESGSFGGAKISDFVHKAVSEGSANAVQKETTDLAEEETRPVVGLVNQIISDAIRLGASDVHIEPRNGRIDVRYRIDGLMRLVRELPFGLLHMLVARLKIMAEMDLMETRVPLDGRSTVVIDNREVDLRVSSLPSRQGQRMVLRILDKTRSLKPLHRLGFLPDHLALFLDLIKRPYGIFLVTGPTGSGKTTTLYAALQELRDTTRNVMTCEDPIEYEIEGVNQSQVNEKVGLTFGAQLRAILRQDPDVILIGEIRDAETAETAIRAALTGHLVLSTLHCNDAPSAIPRLLDIGVDPYLLSACLLGVMSQRLVRTICKECAGVGCPHCAQSGFRGRCAVHEILEVTPQVAAAIGRQTSMEELLELAFAAGYRPMSAAADRIIAMKVTTRVEAEKQIYFGKSIADTKIKLVA